MMPAAPDKEFARDALLSSDGMLAAGIGTRDIAALVARPGRSSASPGTSLCNAERIPTAG